MQKKEPRRALYVTTIYLQLEARYFAGIEPPHTHVSCPLDVKVGVNVIVAPSIVESLKPRAVAVTTAPSQLTPETYVDDWVCISALACAGKAF